MDQIIEALSDPERADDRNVSTALFRLKAIPVVEDRREAITQLLLPLLSDEDSLKRERAMEVLVVWHSAAAIPRAIELLADEDFVFRRSVLELLGKTKDPRAMEAVAQHWAAGNDRRWAAAALCEMGPAAEPMLLKHLASSDSRTVCEGCQILEKIGTRRSIPRLTTLIRSQDFMVRAAASRANQAITAARRTRENPTTIAPADEPADAAATASSPGAGSAPAAPISADSGIVATILADLKGDDETRCEAAAEELAGMEPPQQGREEVAKALTALLSEKEETVRIAALKALGKWHVPQSIPEMAARLDDDSFQVRKAAFNALGSTKDPAAAEALAKRLDGNSAGDATRNLQAIGPIAEDAVLKCLDDSRPQVLILACKTLGEIGTEKSAAKLETLGDHADFSVGAAASVAVSKIRSRPIVP